jgi:hypothetical protein
MIVDTWIAERGWQERRPRPLADLLPGSGPSQQAWEGVSLPDKELAISLPG